MRIVLLDFCCFLSYHYSEASRRRLTFGLTLVPPYNASRSIEYTGITAVFCTWAFVD